MPAVVDPLAAKYDLGRNIGSAPVGQVFVAVCLETGFSKAVEIINPRVSKHGTESIAVKVMRKCSHPNIIVLEDVIKSLSGLALVFPVFDMDLRTLIRSRRRAPCEFPGCYRLRICHVIWFGLAYLHSLHIMRKDVKPANVLVRFGSKVHAVLADIGLASDASTPSIVAGSLASDELLIAHVCTDTYVAPELLAVRAWQQASHGPVVDVWSASVIVFEVASLQRRLGVWASIQDQLLDIGCRLGSVPEFYASHVPREKVASHSLDPHTAVMCEPSVDIVRLGLQWDACARGHPQRMLHNYKFGSLSMYVADRSIRLRGTQSIQVAWGQEPSLHRRGM